MHLRRVAPPDRAAAEALVERTAAPFLATVHVRRLIGHLVLEFLPNVDWHKGARDALDCPATSNAVSASRRGSCSSATT